MKYKWNQLENKMYDFILTFSMTLIVIGLVIELFRKF